MKEKIIKLRQESVGEEIGKVLGVFSNVLYVIAET